MPKCHCQLELKQPKRIQIQLSLKFIKMQPFFEIFVKGLDSNASTSCAWPCGNTTIQDGRYIYQKCSYFWGVEQILVGRRLSWHSRFNYEQVFRIIFLVFQTKNLLIESYNNCEYRLEDFGAHLAEGQLGKCNPIKVRDVWIKCTQFEPDYLLSVVVLSLGRLWWINNTFYLKAAIFRI